MVDVLQSEELETIRRARGDDVESYRDYIFADDLTAVVTAPDETCLKRRAHNTAGDVKEVMKKRFLDVQDAKTQNMVSKPEVLKDGLYRRRPPISTLATRTRLQRQYQDEARLGCPAVEHDLDVDQPM